MRRGWTAATLGRCSVRTPVVVVGGDAGSGSMDVTHAERCAHSLRPRTPSGAPGLLAGERFGRLGGQAQGVLLELDVDVVSGRLREGPRAGSAPRPSRTGRGWGGRSGRGAFSVSPLVRVVRVCMASRFMSVSSRSGADAPDSRSCAHGRSSALGRSTVRTPFSSLASMRSASTSTGRCRTRLKLPTPALAARGSVTFSFVGSACSSPATRELAALDLEVEVLHVHAGQLGLDVQARRRSPTR